MRVQAAALEDAVQRILLGLGLADPDAGQVAHSMVTATAMGISSHGVDRLPQYAESIGTGQVNRRPRVTVVRNESATALIDADGGYGHRPSYMGVELACELAAQFGLSAVGIRNSHHFGAASVYVAHAAQRGMIAIACSTSAPRLVPPGGQRPVIGNNPLAIGIPAANPVIADFALGSVAIGKLRAAARNGATIEPGLGFDVDGCPTTDPQAIIDGGSLAPAGGHKGHGLAVAVEVLAGILTGSPFGQAAHPHRLPSGGVGHFFVLLDPRRFIASDDQLESGIAELARQVAAAGRSARLPGSVSQSHHAEAMREGVALSDHSIALINEAAEVANVAGLAWS